MREASKKWSHTRNLNEWSHTLYFEDNIGKHRFIKEKLEWRIIEPQRLSGLVGLAIPQTIDLWGENASAGEDVQSALTAQSLPPHAGTYDDTSEGNFSSGKQQLVAGHTVQELAQWWPGRLGILNPWQPLMQQEVYPCFLITWGFLQPSRLSFLLKNEHSKKYHSGEFPFEYSFLMLVICCCCVCEQQRLRKLQTALGSWIYSSRCSAHINLACHSTSA